MAAIRETREEIGIITTKFTKLETVASIPSICFRDHEKWGSDVIVISEYSFGLDITDEKVNLSHEHTQYRWEKYIEAKTLLKYDSNKTALYELNKRPRKGYADLASSGEKALPLAKVLGRSRFLSKFTGVCTI